MPLLTVGSLFTGLQILVPGTNNNSSGEDFWRLYVYGTGHFWFLQALFIIFALVGVLDLRGILGTSRRLCAAIVVAVALSLFCGVPSIWAFFSVDGALKLLPLFLLGSWSAQYGLRTQRLRVGFLLAFALALLAKAFLPVSDSPIQNLAGEALDAALSLTAVATLVAWRHLFAWQPLAVLGYFSFVIYLLHVFATAPTRMLLGNLGVGQEAVVFALSLMLGVAIPIGFQLTFGRSSWVSWLVIGQRPEPSRVHPRPLRVRAGDQQWGLRLAGRLCDSQRSKLRRTDV